MSQGRTWNNITNCPDAWHISPTLLINDHLMVIIELNTRHIEGKVIGVWLPTNRNHAVISFNAVFLTVNFVGNCNRGVILDGVLSHGVGDDVNTLFLQVLDNNANHVLVEATKDTVSTFNDRYM